MYNDKSDSFCVKCRYGRGGQLREPAGELRREGPGQQARAENGGSAHVRSPLTLQAAQSFQVCGA